MDALARSTDVFEDFFVSARIGLALADLSGCYVRVNATYAELVGRLPEDLVGVPLSDVLPDSPTAYLAATADGNTSGTPYEQSHQRLDGTVAWVLHGVAVVRGPDDAPAWYAVSAQDITERRRAEQELREMSARFAEQAIRDQLTGLANRRLFEERLRAALSRDARSGGTTGVLFLDLDGFKQVNDRHGHSVGDAVLQTVAARLSGAVRPSDTVARLGGDEFVVLVGDATEAGMAALTERLSRAVRAPLELQGLTLDVGVSVGQALATDGNADPSGLVSRADAQMYTAKRENR
jgi:diguanylate cyclase (GGDEF)-like protein/PAS domain S-box-containing protein